eukprot:2138167-Amphidinium_carterae.2
MEFCAQEHLMRDWREFVTLLPVLRGADVIVFTDNNVVKSALVSGVAASLANRSMLNVLSMLAVELGGRTWITRALSANNPAVRVWTPLVRDTEVYPPSLRAGLLVVAL